MRYFGRILFLALLALPASWSKAQEVIDPAEAAKDPDFAVQGEYVGDGTWPGGDTSRVGAQVIASSQQKFRLVFYRGGLPGNGWQRGDDRLRAEGETKDGVTSFAGEGKISGVVDGKTLSLSDAAGKSLAALKRVTRQSPTLGAKPPQGATVLFNGSNPDNFKNGKLSSLKTLEAGCDSKEKIKAVRLHLEFRLSWKPKARGQGRSNSGVFIGGIPEIQVLDSFGLEGAKNECGAFYSRKEPDVNMCLPPLVWQTYDVEFYPPVEGKSDKYSVTVKHNGVVIHDKYPTNHKNLVARALSLQKHGNRVQYQNIWYLPAE